jgi:hypothetical protein
MTDQHVASVLDILRSSPEILEEPWCGPFLVAGNRTMRAALKMWQEN